MYKGKQEALGWLMLGKYMRSGDLTAVFNFMVGRCRQAWECVEWLHLLRSSWWKGEKQQLQAKTMGNSASKVFITMTVIKQGPIKIVTHPSLEVIKIQLVMTLRNLI